MPPRTLSLDRNAVRRELCQKSFWDFVVQFWECVPRAGKMVANWHIELFCEEMQALAERVFVGLPRLHDEVINVSPGTSKSTIVSILFPAWVWTRMPHARILTGSYADSLVLDLSAASRDVVKSEKYQITFPHVRIRSDKDAKGNYGTTAGGERMTCTVGGKSPLGRHAHFILIDDPIDPKEALSDPLREGAARFVTEYIANRKVDKAVTVTVLIMQRLGVGDPTEVMLDLSRRPGAKPVRHVCLPAELPRGDDGAWDTSHVVPQELAGRYVNGLMDPHRLGREVLDENKARGDLFYATQFLQRPYQPGGGMFKDTYFTKRVKAAPFEAERIRYWDRAYTEGESACNTVGTLMARSKDGRFYVEDVVVGKWEPSERDEKMLATAQKDRLRYGPRYEPRIYVEQEPAAGKESYQYTARTLAGFAVYPDRVHVNKELRAEPWSCQCAGGSVYIVDNGKSEGIGEPEWDIAAWVNEHCAFPGGPYKDRVDSAGGAFAKLLPKRNRPGLKSLPLRERGKPGQLRLIICTMEELPDLGTDERTLLVLFHEPGTPDALPPHAFQSLTAHACFSFADLDPAEVQHCWGEPLAPYGKLPADLVMKPEDARRLWAFLLKNRPERPELIVLADWGCRIAYTVALEVCSALRLDPREMGISENPTPGTVNNSKGNPHVAVLLRSTKGSVRT